MEPNTTIDSTQLNKNIEEYGFDAAMKWATYKPNTIGMDLKQAFEWRDSEEGHEYWRGVSKNRKSNQPTTKVTPPKEVKEEPKVSTATNNTTVKSSSKVLPFEEEIQRRLDERKATNAKNKAIHEKALELAEASRKKLEKKLKKLMEDEGVDAE